MKDPPKPSAFWLHLRGSNPYHGTIMKDPHKLDPRAMERSSVVSWLHLKEAQTLITGQL